jgi:hypothetical protein
MGRILLGKVIYLAWSHRIIWFVWLIGLFRVFGESGLSGPQGAGLASQDVGLASGGTPHPLRFLVLALVLEA